MVKLKANKKLIRAHVEEATDKVVIMKDIHNASKRSSTAGQSHSETELETLSKYIEENLPGVSMHVKHNENKEVTSILIQDDIMKENFHKYPEVILVDATHKLNQQNMPLYSIIVVDGNLKSHPVCFFLVVREDERTVREMIQTFKVSKWLRSGAAKSRKPPPPLPTSDFMKSIFSITITPLLFSSPASKN